MTMLTEEEFDRRVEEAMESHGDCLGASERALLAALSMAWEANPTAAAVLSWNHGKLSAKRDMEALREIATGRRDADAADRYGECGRCSHGHSAVWCDATHRMMMADAHGDPSDYRCDFKEDK